MAKKQSAEDETKPDAAAPADGEKKPRGKKAAAADGTAPAAAEAPKPAAPKATDPNEKKKKKKPGVSPRRGKKLRTQMKNAFTKLSKEGQTPLRKAVSLLKGLRRAKFDESVEVHMSLGIDSTQSEQMIRGSVPLPHGVGKTVRVVVFCQGEDITKAKEAGADFAGADDLIKKIQQENWLDFDVALATQSMMGQVSRLGKVLGPRGLMPTPKAGTVITGGDVAAAVKDFKAGKVEYRTDKGGNVHAGVGKISFDEEKLTANATAFIEAIRAAKPSGVKGHYIKSITICSTMSPGVRVTA
ncbi:MAG: 50S ribosomal protein L1 [Gemmataceae bacterium]